MVVSKLVTAGEPIDRSLVGESSSLGSVSARCVLANGRADSGSLGAQVAQGNRWP